jgi:hypothetical protein
MYRAAFFIIIILLRGIDITAQNNVCFTIVANPNPSDPAFGVFSKYVDVYGCGIYAEGTVSDANVLHAAAIWAELIDNDEDGVVDDAALLTELQSKSAFMPIFQSDGNAAMTTFSNNYSGNGASAVLWQTEMDPAQPGHWGDDATIEEILHTINSVGHVDVYPSAFSMATNSSLLSTAMDSARGGQFIAIPAPYPAGAWYHYDDGTCDYECMATEYLYWMIVSNMGILDDTATCTGIANEWEPCSQALLQSTDVLGYALITNPTYKLPQNAPDGNYCPNSSSIYGVILSRTFDVFPNPSSALITIEITDNNPLRSIHIRNVLGQTVRNTVVSSQTNQIDISELNGGMYFITYGAETIKLVVQ